jgi:lysophospholipase L1-like esterase
MRTRRSCVLNRNVLFLMIPLFIVVFVCAASSAAPYPLRDAQECRVRGGLPNVFRKLQSGKAVRIAYLGGSITSQAGWRPKTLQWFQQQYPRAQVTEINAAIGGTGSDLGVFRLEHDVLRHRPDLLFVEFAVNDGGAPPERIHKAMEGIIRQTIKANPNTDICYVYTLTRNMVQTLQDGKFPRAASAMEVLADHYDIPSIHMGLQVARLVKQGKVIFQAAKPKTPAGKQSMAGKILFSPDGVHPYTDTGHQLYLDAVVRSIPQIQSAGSPGPHTLRKPLRADNWEQAAMVPLNRVKLSSGWQKLDPKTHTLAKRFAHRMPELYKANRPGETIDLRFRGTHLKIYDLLGPDCGQVTIRIDERNPVVKPRFDAYCTYHRLATLSVASDLPNTVHTVSLEIHPDQPDKAEILKKRNQKIDNPKRYDDTAWYAGAILIMGELVE